MAKMYKVWNVSPRCETPSPQMNTQVCRKRVLVSDLPKEVEEKRLLDRLEIHFSKLRNQGGEVFQVDILQESGNVVITFVEDTGGCG